MFFPQCIMLILTAVVFGQAHDGPAREGPDISHVEIVNTGKYMPYVTTNIDAGPATGFILNYHYFPGINFYNGGRYKEAEEQFTYVIMRPYYLAANPRQAEFMSTAYYLRGMIYLYHANGIGRHSQAKEDFEASLKWNPSNHVVYLEIARLYASLGFRDQAATIIQQLLQLKPAAAVAEAAQKELETLTQKSN
jgi:tetratricopeptide (TPR) repeat protein